MSHFFLFATIFTTGALALPSNTPSWIPAGLGDVRSPCPLLNTLANHDIIPHNGKNITIPILEVGFKKYVNLGTDLAIALGEAALKLSPIPNSNSFDLDNVDVHDAIEHDGSLSRNDYYFGNDYSFNPFIYEQTASYFTEPFINITTGAIARNARVTNAKAVNPTYNLTGGLLTASLTETPFYLSIMGDPYSGIANTEWVNIFFTQERLPYLEGWTPRAQETNLTTLGAMVPKIIAATPAMVSPPGFSFDVKLFTGIH